MSADENTMLARRLFDEGWSKGNVTVLSDLVATTYAGHDPTTPAGIHGVAGLTQYIAGYRAAFPDLSFTLDEVYAIGDNRVLARWTAHGTHRGALMGIPASGKHATVGGLTLSRIESGKIVEDYTHWDALGLMQQLGAIPAAPQPTQGTDTRPATH
ncbi:MAG TPA: ester cyclase [Ktedonobacterales bacterium]